MQTKKVPGLCLYRAMASANKRSCHRFISLAMFPVTEQSPNTPRNAGLPAVVRISAEQIIDGLIRFCQQIALPRVIYPGHSKGIGASTPIDHFGSITVLVEPQQGQGVPCPSRA